MKLAHLILAHSTEPQLERLIKHLQHTDADIYIHVDKKASLNPFYNLQKNNTFYLINNRIAVDWGNFNMVEATLSGFEEILAKGDVYSHINLLSAQDYPLKSPTHIQHFLFANADKTFMRYFLIPDEWDEPIERLTKYNFGDYNFPGKHLVQRLANTILPNRRPPGNIKIYGRSQWITITPACAQYVINHLKNNKAVYRYFKQTWACDELIFQTILLNSPLKSSVVNDHLRYIKFKPGDSRPQTLTMANAADIIISDKFYGRKFDINVDEQILDYIDKLNV
jgi:hypothetical protein